MPAARHRYVQQIAEVLLLHEMTFKTFRCHQTAPETRHEERHSDGKMSNVTLRKKCLWRATVTFNKLCRLYCYLK